MPIVDLEQGSEDWIKYRQTRVMATSAAIILGVNPWKNVLQLWEDLNGISQVFVMNEKMERGTRLEPQARKLASSVIGIEFEPCVYESNNHYWMAASLDGLSKCGKFILEIKCPNEKTHNMAINDQIPEYYYAQIQHQLEVTKSEMAYYFSYNPDNSIKYAIVKVYPNQEYIMDLVKKEDDFWSKVCRSEIPVWQFKK